jgi:predicted nucleic acid-binding protein
MSDVVYFDTSALAKWYLNEPRSDEVEAYLQTHGPVAISWLTVVEMRSLLARRRRERHFDAELEWRVFATFQQDVRAGHLILHPMEGDPAALAVSLLGDLPSLPLRTLDALHLAVAKGIRADTLATADKLMAEAAGALGFKVVPFF